MYKHFGTMLLFRNIDLLLEISSDCETFKSIIKFVFLICDFNEKLEIFLDNISFFDIIIHEHHPL